MKLAETTPDVHIFQSQNGLILTVLTDDFIHQLSTFQSQNGLILTSILI